MSTCTPDRLTAFVATIGHLSRGAHRSTNECCILEAVSLCEGRSKTDDPDTIDRPDCRSLNDGPWSSDEARTAGMLRLAPLLAAWPTWGQARRIEWARAVALHTFRELLPIVLREIGLEAEAVACEQASTLEAAAQAADAANARAATNAAYTAHSADAASSAVHSACAAHYAAEIYGARRGEADRILNLACTIWADAAGETK